VTELHWWPAHEQAAAIRERRLSSVEVVTHHLDRIDALDDRVNAIPVRLPREQALAAAAQADAAVARGDELGLLHGLPIAVKDLMDVAGLPTTHGFVPFADAVATHDSLIVEYLRAAGAIIVGKTNTPESGLGTLTFNALFGPTRNPYALDRHAGGSSGGAGAAVAAGLLPLADGSDSGGSIRYPASFCNIVGLRPSPGRVVTGRRDNGWDPHGVLGPMARSSRDAGLLLAAISGRDDRAPISIDQDPAAFLDLQPGSLRGLRVAWSPTGGGLPIDADVRRVLAQARERLVDEGAIVVDVEPDFLAAADAPWQVIEMLGFLASAREFVAEHRDAIRPDLVRNVEEGRALTADAIATALAQRTDIYRATVALLTEYDVLALPATPVAAPPIEDEWVHEIDGVPLDRYFLWQRLACRVTVTAHPALSVPAGFTDGGLPVGLQVVGRNRGELELLRFGAAFEAATGFGERRPAL
jgi:amidase